MQLKAVVGLLAAGLLAAACGGGVVMPGGTDGPGRLTGAGATFPAPLYQRWAEEYRRRTGVQVNYQAIGSGGGIQQITAATVDFGATDVPMTDEELTEAATELVHVPTAFGAVAVVYHLPGVPSGLKLSPEVLAGIFLGQITVWNDPALGATNPAMVLPPEEINVVHRSDGSGTTAVFSAYLSQTSRAWRRLVGAGKELEWPTGVGGKGNEGVTALVRLIPGAIGYVELAYARQTGLATAAVRNRAGSFVLPELSAVSAAAASAQVPDDLRFSVVNVAGARAYPLTAATWLLVRRHQADPARAGTLGRFLWWAIHDGQRYNQPLLYAPLPPSLVTRAEQLLRTITPPTVLQEPGR
jgi:phosphate transport system substrate-binding protein